MSGARQRGGAAVQGRHSAAVCRRLDGRTQADTAVHHQHRWDYGLRNGLVQDVGAGVACTARDYLERSIFLTTVPTFGNIFIFLSNYGGVPS